MKLNLVENGIFPIIYDKNGNLLEKPIGSTGMNVAGTYQGEGGLLGTPCLFIRLSGCNLRCAWVGLDGIGSPCDTPYSSHNAEKNQMEIEDIVDIVKANTIPQHIKHIVISGGEPTLQADKLLELVTQLSGLNYHITMETNGTTFDDRLAEYIDLISMSPKLSSSTPWESHLIGTGIEYNDKKAQLHEQKRININSIQSWIDNSIDFQLKFVVTDKSDVEEIEAILNQLTGFEPSDVFLMPEGVDINTLNKRTKWAVEEALKHGWRFTPRLHIQMFGQQARFA